VGLNRSHALPGTNPSATLRQRRKRAGAQGGESSIEKSKEFKISSSVSHYIKFKGHRPAKKHNGEQGQASREEFTKGSSKEDLPNDPLRVGFYR